MLWEDPEKEQIQLNPPIKINHKEGT